MKYAGKILRASYNYSIKEQNICSNCKNKYIAMKYAGTVLRAPLYSYSIKN